MIEVNQLRYERDRRCGSCAFNDDVDVGEYGECLNYKIQIEPDRGRYCHRVRKECRGEFFKNREPINKLFPRLPVNVIAVPLPEPGDPFPHYVCAGIVTVLSLMVLLVRIWVMA